MVDIHFHGLQHIIQILLMKIKKNKNLDQQAKHSSRCVIGIVKVLGGDSKFKEIDF